MVTKNKKREKDNIRNITQKPDHNEGENTIKW